MNATAAINAYNKVGMESSIFGADPHQLVAMLYQGALLEIAKAKDEVARNQTAAKGKSISRAIAIIGEGLNASLNKEVGGDLARNLSSLYDYMVVRLVDANLKKDIATLDEVARLLTELSEAWASISPKIRQTAPPPSASANAHRAYTTA